MVWRSITAAIFNCATQQSVIRLIAREVTDAALHVDPIGGEDNVNVEVVVIRYSKFVLSGYAKIRRA